MGEHFVVYGTPALAVPVAGLELCAEIIGSEPECRGGSRAEPGSGEPAFADSLPKGSAEPTNIEPRSHLHACLELACMYFDVPACGLDVEVCSSIPIGAGLGSSAAVSVAVARAVAELRGRADGVDLVESIRSVSMEAERRAHGKPSGIDTEVCLTGCALRFTKGSTPQRLELGRPASGAGPNGAGPNGAGSGSVGIVVMNTGIPSSTARMVALAGEYARENSRRFERLSEETGKAVDSAARALIDGDAPWLGQLMTDQHGRLKEIGVSCADIETLVTAALEEGALGAKLSGAGGGGVVVAACEAADAAGLASRLEERRVDVLAATRI
jgi:mevalonate kinase